MRGKCKRLEARKTEENEIVQSLQPNKFSKRRWNASREHLDVEFTKFRQASIAGLANRYKSRRLKTRNQTAFAGGSSEPKNEPYSPTT